MTILTSVWSAQHPNTGQNIQQVWYIWLMNSLSPALKQHILAASSNALRLLNNIQDMKISYEQIHKVHKRATPMDIMKYRLSIQLFKIYNGYILNDDWMNMNVQQNFNARLNSIQINDMSNLRIGKKHFIKQTRNFKQ